MSRPGLHLSSNTATQGYDKRVSLNRVSSTEENAAIKPTCSFLDTWHTAYKTPLHPPIITAPPGTTRMMSSAVKPNLIR